MWPHGRRLCHCTMYQPGGTPMCSCNWPASGNDAGNSAQYPRPVTSSNRNSSSSSTSIAGTSTDKCNMTSQWYQPMVPNLNFVTDTAPRLVSQSYSSFTHSMTSPRVQYNDIANIHSHTHTYTYTYCNTYLPPRYLYVCVYWCMCYVIAS